MENREAQCNVRQILSECTVVVYKGTHFDEKLVPEVPPKQAQSTVAQLSPSILKEHLP